MAVVSRFTHQASPVIRPFVAAFVLLLLSLLSLPAAPQVLSGHVPAAVHQRSPIAALSATNDLRLALCLPLRNTAALQALLHDLYDPASPSFHQFITPEEFAARFGPSEADYQALKDFAHAHNLEITTTHPNRTILDVKASAGKIEKALNVKFHLYQHPSESRAFYAPDADPSPDLSVPLLHISGLDDFFIPKPRMQKMAANFSNANPRFGSGPGGTYQGLDFRNAYVPGTPLNGNGQSIGLLEFDGYFSADIAAYVAQANLPAVPLANVFINGYNGAAGFGNSEVSLDIEMCIAMAPGLSKIYVYEAPNPSPWVDLLNRMATDNLSKQLSCSWGGGPPNAAGEQIFMQMAAQGQSFFDAIGDSDAFTGFIPFPGESTNIVQVGGTTLFTSGPLGSYSSERVWNWGGGVGSSGGISVTYGLPPWQLGIDMTLNHGSTAFRNLPDVALTADNIFIIADNGTPENVGGTSAAAPLWAAFTALVNQQGALSGRQPVGFLNPAIYAIGKSSVGSILFHDITVGDNTSPASPNNFFAVSGLDLCTGWGTPAGTNLINILAPPFPTPVLVVVTNFISGGNGNGVIDPDECNDLTVVLQNIGSRGATNVTATISTTNAGVIIAQRSSAYVNLATNGFGTNLSAFRISTTPNFICGTVVTLDMQIKCDQAVFAAQLLFPTGTIDSSNHFETSFPVSIPDNDPAGADSPIAVSGFIGNIGKVTVSLYLNHTFDSDLQIALVGPDGTSTILSQNEGGSGDNFGFSCPSDSAGTMFDDSSTRSLSSSQPPFIGVFTPDQPLSVFNGKFGTNVNGIWKIHAVDQAFIDTGTIQCWALDIFPIKCTEGGGQCPGVDLSIGMTSAPEPATQFSNFVYTINVTNAGPDTAHGTVISQILPSSVTFISATASQGGISQANGIVTANLGNLPAGAVATATVTVSANTSGAVSSTASISSNNTDFDPSNNSVTLVSHINPPFSDLSIGILAAPNPVQVGQTLTYTVLVTNNGPTLAANVTVTNVLSPSVGILAVSGSNSVSANTVVSFFGNLTNGAVATAVIQVRPNLEGNVSATATVYTTGTDPNPANNSATVLTVVGPSADLALGLSANSLSVVRGSNIIYTISVTNLGPSAASSVVLNDSLPAGLAVISTNSTKGTLTVSGSSVTAAIGTLTNGETARVTIGITTTNASAGVTLVDSASVTATESDPRTTNNSASVSVLVAAPFVAFAVDSAQLDAESFSPPDGAVEPGETVTARFFLENTGNVPNTGSGLLVTLLATNGITSPSGPQNYGNIGAGGVQSRSFSFTAGGTNGGTIVANLLLQDPSGTNILTYTFQLPRILTFANTNRIDIPTTAQDQLQPGPAAPYPSAINVSGVTGFLGRVTVTLSNLNHTFPHDINLLLVGPTGIKTLLLSDAANDSSVSGADVTFDDFAPDPIPASGQIVSTSYQPSVYDSAAFLTNPAPAGPYGTQLSAYQNPDPNGLWSLYAYDDSQGDFGYVGGGWSISFTSISPVNEVADLAVSASSSPASVLVGGVITNTFTIHNNGPGSVNVLWITNTVSSSVTLISVTNSVGTPFAVNGNILSADLGLLPNGATRTVTLVVSPNSAGSITNSLLAASVSGEMDISPADDFASAVFAAQLPVADLMITNYVTPNPVTVGSNTTVTIAVTNLGPNNALNVLVSNALPAGLSLVSSNASQGSVSVVGGAAIASLGSIAPGSNAVVTLAVRASAQGTISNLSRVYTSSSDPISSNNASTVVLSVAQPVPFLIPSGATLLSESFSPPDASIKSGETVTVALYLANSGSADSTNLTATLLAGNGVTAPSGSQNYGTLVRGGPAISRNFTFTAASTTNGVILATLQLADAGGYATNVTFSFNLPVVVSNSNATAISIPDHGPAAPYPSIINISGVTGAVQKVSVSLNGLSHTFPHDLDVLLVSPSGLKVMLMADCGGGHPVSGVNLTFDDSAISSLSDSAQIVSGVWKPTDFNPTPALPAPVPSGPVFTSLSTLTGVNPNGNWSLFVFDHSSGDSGSISAGWSLSITTINPVNPAVNLVLGLAASPNPVLVGGTLTYTFTLTNRGPSIATNVVLTDHLPAGLTLTSSNTTVGTLAVGGTTVTITNLSLAPSAGLTATLRVIPSFAGSIVNTGAVTSAQMDLDLPSNTAQVATTVVSPIAALLNIEPATNGQFQITLSGDAGLAYTVQASSNLLNWVPVFTGTAAPNGTFRFTTTNANTFNYRFYRSVRLP